MKSTVSPYQTSATCVRIECLNGVTVRLTDYPYDLVMSNSTVYKTDYGYQPTAFTASAAFSPSAIDIDGICAVGGVTRDQLASGVFDNARVYIFKCNFLAPVEDYEEIVAGFFGKTTLEDDKYRIEGMSLIDALNQSVGPVYQASCMHTPWDAGCTLNPAAVTGTLTNVPSAFIVRDSARSEAADHFGAGWIRFTTGNNAGLKALEVKSYAADGSVETFEPFYYQPQIGDAYEMRKGCRRRLADCQSNGNIINFFGFTRIPTGSTYTAIGGVT